jgi:asparagine synthase (glutamine-hydrolysing)
MCGIVGALSARNSLSQVSLVNIRDRLSRRGTDAVGEWLDETAGITLGHRRLSILALSPTSTQPLHAAYSRYVTVFTGEIYNFQRLRDEITHLHPSQVCRGSSDTDFILAGVSYWGEATTITKLDGMFAIAVRDKTEKISALRVTV